MRYKTAAVPLNEHEICVLGGQGDRSQDLSDVVIFDARTAHVETVASAPFGFRTFNNLAAKVRENQVIFLAQDAEMTRILMYKRSQNEVSIVENLFSNDY